MNKYLFPYVIALQAPAIITAPGHRTYSAGTLNYVPGSTIRGVIASRLGDPDGKSELERQRFDRLVISGQVRYRNAYPAAIVNPPGQPIIAERSIPLPLSFKKRKHESPNSKPEILDLLKEHSEDTLVTPDFDFIIPGTTEVQPVRVKLGSRIHHSRDPAKSRPTIDSGNLFTYEHILPNQRFSGYIAVDAGSLEEAKQITLDIKELLSKSLLLGRSRGAGYGGNAHFDLGTKPEQINAIDKIRKDLRAGDSFRVLLLSDFIGRRPETGLIDPTSFQGYLEKALEKEICLCACYVDTGFAGGYNRKARLALPVTRTLSKGSVFVFSTRDDIELASLLEVEASGLGIRLSEGYGELCFLNAPTNAVYEIAGPVSLTQPTQLPNKVDEVSVEILALMQRRILADELDREIHRWTAELVRSDDVYVSPSLIGRLRLALRHKPETALNTFRQWLLNGDSNSKTTGSLRSKATRQLQHCRLNKYSLYDWLQKVVQDDPSFVLEHLSSKQLSNDYFLISANDAEATLRGLVCETKCKVIDAVLAEISRKVRLRERGGKNE